MSTFAMICNHRVIEIIHDVKEAPQWPPDPSGNIVTSVKCSEEATRNWVYDSETGSVREPVIPEPEPEPSQPTQLDSIEQTQLLIMEAMADQYEQRLETDLMMMDAQATTFEAVLALTEGVV